MAEDALNMSLDDIIKQNSQRTQTERSRKRGGPSRGRGAPDELKSFRGRRREGREGRPPVAKPVDESLRVVVGGGVGKQTARRGGRGFRVPRGGFQGGDWGYAPTEVFEAPPRDPGVLDGPKKWEHDMFDGERRERRPLRERLTGDPSGCTLLVENLAFNVSQEDINELFETCGPLRFAELQYDRSGRSEGVARIVFQNPAHAQTAFDQYNKVALDGQPMKITIFRGKPVAQGRMLSSGLSVEHAGGIRSRMSGGGANRVASHAFAQAVGRPSVRVRRGRGGNSSGGFARGRGLSRSKAELDAELDDIMQS